MRADREWLEDIVRSAELIEKFLNGKSKADVLQDQLLQAAVLHHLTIIGEAAARLSPAIKGRASSVPWQDIAGTRNHLVHGYFAVNWDLIWDTLQSELGQLREGS